jgi:ligand-binding SRPBCC domain-containing protein
VRVRTLLSEQLLCRDVEGVFAFFSDVDNLDLLTPPWLHFRILTPGVPMRRGAVIGYRLRWRGVPLSWRTEISAWEAPFRFVDRALESPYLHWRHEHVFEPVGGSTRMTDRVEYAVPGGPLEPAITRWIVGPDLARIFAYRERKMRQLFGAPGGVGVPPSGGLQRPQTG